jgi:hypothetical protein
MATAHSDLASLVEGWNFQSTDTVLQLLAILVVFLLFFRASMAEEERTVLFVQDSGLSTCLHLVDIAPHLVKFCEVVAALFRTTIWNECLDASHGEP